MFSGRFDYYSATVPASAASALDLMAKNLPFRGMKIDQQKGMNSFKHAEVISDGRGERICAILHGGVNPLPHVTASGVYSPDVAQAIRTAWPEHTVSRLDVAVDFDGKGAWEKLYRVCDDAARSSRLKWATLGDFRPDGDSRDGRTVYVGSRQSPVMVRLYEKGKQLASSVQMPGEMPSLDWVRLEIEVKPPNRAAKMRAASLSPEQSWGCAPWARDILRSATGTGVERVNMQIKRLTDEERAFFHMARQYRSVIEGMIRKEGSPEAVMRLMQDVWRADDEGAVRPSVGGQEHFTVQ